MKQNNNTDFVYINKVKLTIEKWTKNEFTMELVEIDKLDVKTIPLLLQCLPNESKEKIYKFKFQDDAIRSLIGELLVRDYFSKMFGMPLENILISHTDYGKPYVESGNTFFSISHSGKYVCVCFSKFQIGVDIERIHHDYTLEEIKCFCTQKEIELSNNCSDIWYYYTRLWVLKESYVKAVGCGLSDQIRSIGFEYADDEYTFSSHNAMFSCLCIDDYCISICLLGV